MRPETETTSLFLLPGEPAPDPILCSGKFTSVFNSHLESDPIQSFQIAEAANTYHANKIDFWKGMALPDNSKGAIQPISLNWMYHYFCLEEDSAEKASIFSRNYKEAITSKSKERKTNANQSVNDAYNYHMEATSAWTQQLQAACIPAANQILCTIDVHNPYVPTVRFLDRILPVISSLPVSPIAEERQVCIDFFDLYYRQLHPHIQQFDYPTQKELRIQEFKDRVKSVYTGVEDFIQYGLDAAREF